MSFSRRSLFYGFLLALVGVGLVSAVPVFAQDTKAFAEAIGLATGASLPVIITRLIRTVISFVGIVAVVMVIYAGFLWMTAGGNPTRLTKAKGILSQALIGIVIVISAFTIVQFVLNSLLGSGGGGDIVCDDPAGCPDPTNNPPPGTDYTKFSLEDLNVAECSTGIRNLQPQFVFTKSVSANAAEAAISIMRVGGTVKVPGTFTASGRYLTFTPDDFCEPPNDTINCFAKDTDYEINIDSSLKSIDDSDLTCPVGSLYCGAIPFHTGSDVDLTNPTISIQSPESGASINVSLIEQLRANTADDTGVSSVNFYAVDSSLSFTAGPQFFSEEGQVMGGGENNTFFTDANEYWSPSSLVTNKSYPVWASGSDCAGNTATASKVNVMVRAAHCFNKTTDIEFGETGEDCGGNASDAEYCGACSNDPCTENSQCASGFCEEGICVSKLLVKSISPGDGAVGNLVTISGTGFGTAGGKIRFLGGNDSEVKEVSAYQCGTVSKWSDNEIVVQVPVGATDGPIEVIAQDTTKHDRTDDLFGPLFNDFDVNSIVRPGLCAVNPVTSSQGSIVDFTGLGFGSAINSAGLYFKNFLSPDLTAWSSTAFKAKVPNMSAGNLSTQLFTGNYVCLNKAGAALVPPKNCLIDKDCGVDNTCSASWCSQSLAACVFDSDCDEEEERCVSRRVGSNKLSFIVKDVAGPTAVPVISYVESGWKTCASGTKAGQVCGTKLDCGGTAECVASPTQGPIGQTITIFGTNFGTSEGSVHFKFGLGNVALGDKEFSNQQCSGLWKDTSITIKVPKEFNDEEQSAITTGNYQISITTNPTGAGSKTSNSVDFEVVTGKPGPSICLLDPSSGPIGTEVDILGENLGSTETVNFFKGEGASYDFKDNQSITNVEVPVGAESGPVTVKMITTGFTSNSLNFKVGLCPSQVQCVAGETCCGDGSCSKTCKTGPPVSHFAYKVSTGDTPTNPSIVISCNDTAISPTPWSNWADSKTVCLNAAVSATFTKEIDPTSLVGNVKVEQCSVIEEDICTTWITVPGDLTSDETSFEWGPTVDFAPNAKYQVTIVGKKDDDFGVTDPDGVPFLNDYVWQFTTGGVNDICEVGGVLTTPSDFTATEQNQLIAYSAKLIAKDKRCILVDSAENITWTIDKTLKAKFEPDPGGAKTATVQALEETVGDNPVKIKAQVLAVSGQPFDTADLTVDFSDPTIEAYFPICSAACVNVQPWFRFKTDIIQSTVSPSTVILLACENALCAPGEMGKVNLVGATSCKITNPDTCPKGTPEYLTIKNALLPNTWYRIFLDGNQIKSPSGVALKDSGSNFGTEQNLYFNGQFSWKFKTKPSSVACGIDKLTVAPLTKMLKVIGDRQSYVATAYSIPDECDASGQALQTNDISWDAWTALDTPDNNKGSSDDVAFMLESGEIQLADQLPNYCSSSCLNLGTKVNKTQAICGDGVISNVSILDGIIASEECEPGAGCSSVCLRVGTQACGSTIASKCCGNKITEVGEDCDDGNSVSGDGCSAQCLNEGSSSIGSICGDGKVDFFEQTGGEDCDDGNKKNGDGCSSQCLFEGSVPKASVYATCGNAINGETEYGEDCDDGNNVSGDGCSSICLNEGSSSNYGSVCGNNLVETGEDCDFGDKLNGDGCSSKCLWEGSSLQYAPDPSFCGNGGAPEKGEECEALAPNITYATRGYAAAEINTSAPLEVINGAAYSVITAETDGKKGEAMLGIQCSCELDVSCGDAKNVACGTGSCCFPRPKVGTVLPVPNPNGPAYCRNTAISVEFNQKMNPDSFGIPEGVTVANIRLQLVKKNGIDIGQSRSSCPASYQYIASNGQPSHNLFVRAWNWLRSLFGQAVSAAPNGCFANLSFSTIDLPHGSQKVLVNYKELLEANADYQIVIVGDNNLNDLTATGVVSENKVGLCLGTSSTTCKELVTYRFSVGADVCALDSVQVVDNGKVTKASYESASPYFFSKKDELHSFTSTALSSKAGTGTYEQIQSVPGTYEWVWNWSSSIDDTVAENIVSKLGPSVLGYAEFQAAGVNGSEHVIATARITEDTLTQTDDTEISGSAEVFAFLCERPWPQAPSPFPYIDTAANTNFGFYYCMDRGVDGQDEDLPALAYVDVQSIGGQDFIQELLFKVGNTSDAIGVRVIKNPLYLSPEAWFKSQDFIGGYQAMIVDGYQAVQSGNTIYAAAANKNGATLYSNIYVISYNPNAGVDAREIFAQIAKNWRFNAKTTDVSNVALCKVGGAYVQTASGGFVGCTWDGDCLEQFEQSLECSRTKFQPEFAHQCPLIEAKKGYCDSDKAKLQRDLNRLTDITSTVAKLDAYGAQHKHCSVTKGISCSVNEQCPGAEICVEGYPTLQEGTFIPSISVSKWDSWNAQLSNKLGTALPVDPLDKFWNSCNLTGGYDPATCFNGLQGIFVCPDKSHVYGYQSFGGEAYKLFTQLEYNKTKWNDPIDIPPPAAIADDVTIVAEYTRGTSFSSLPDGFTTSPTFCGNQNWGVTQICGDGIVGAGEDCELGMTDNLHLTTGCGVNNNQPGTLPRACTSKCKWQTEAEAKAVGSGAVCVPLACGNGVLENEGTIHVEECDDGILNGTYGHCGSDCKISSAVTCGDGYLSGGEQCDCGNAATYPTVSVKPLSYAGINKSDLCAVSNGQYRTKGSCSYDCKLPGPSCGDLEVNDAEECDGGIESYAGFLCTDGQTKCSTNDDCPANPSKICLTGGTGASCGSKTICIGGSNAGLACGNPTPSCPGGTCSTFAYDLTRTRTCKLKTDPNACTWNNWTPCQGGDQVCGNGKLEGTEECDDGNLSNSDACTNVCKNNICGDGHLYEGVESCDEGTKNIPPNTPMSCDTYDGTCNFCNTLCQYKTSSGEYCGDGKISGDEFCDGDLIPKRCFPVPYDNTLPVSSICKVDVDCETNYKCRTVGVCNGGAGNGAPCTDNSQCANGTCSLPICADDCSGACPFTFQESQVMVQSELDGSQPQPAINLFGYLNTKKESPDNANILLPACLVGTKLTANVNNTSVNFPALDIVFVTDISWTMFTSPSDVTVPSPDRKIDIVSASLVSAIDKLFTSYPTNGGELRIGLVRFAKDVTIDSPLVNREGTNKQDLLKIAKEYATKPHETGTRTAHAIQQAIDMLAGNSDHVKIVVLLTDGQMWEDKTGTSCSKLSGDFDTEDGKKTFGGERYCAAQIRYEVMDVLDPTPDLTFFYSAMITKKDSYKAYGEHMSSMVCKGVSMSDPADCNENDAGQIGKYAYSASTKEGITLMYDEIIKSVLSANSSVTFVKGVKAETQSTITPIGNNVKLDLPPNFQCNSQPSSMPLRTNFYGSGTLKFDNFKFTYCPAP